jgi:hypothetical protein
MRWAKIAALIVAFQYLAAFLIGSVSGWVYPMPVGGIATIGLCFLVIVLGGYSAFRVAVYHRKKLDPLPLLIADLKRNADFPILVFLVCAQSAVLGWLKAMMPHAVGFWADPALADLDALIFGTDPWKLLHPSPHWIGDLMDRFYMSWAFLTLLMLSALGFAGQSAFRDRMLIAHFLVTAFAALGQYLCPSAGPVFYEAIGLGNRFAEIPIHPWVKATSDFLWDSYTTQARVGSGISAMPSLHVAGAAWLALCFGSLAPKLKLIGWSYFTIILVGSVYLGWHYAVDGFAGMGLALLAWRVAGFKLPSWKVMANETVPV